jgi:hypothetical protein
MLLKLEKQGDDAHINQLGEVAFLGHEVDVLCTKFVTVQNVVKAVHCKEDFHHI